MPLSQHRYERQFDTTSGDSLAQLSEWVPAGSTVLELGPAGGYFTRHLQESLHCVVDAVEIDCEMAEAARPWCRRLLQGDLETLTLTELFEAHAYDVIVLADVLEHLRFPERILLQLPALLKQDGFCLISVPNVAYGGLIAGLLEGHFDYRNEGLLDRTHLRFFTQHSLAALLGETGWHPWDWRSVNRSFFDSEFRTRLETLPAEMTSLLRSRPALQCYQWLVKAKRHAPETPPALREKPFSEGFPVRIFWAGEKAGEEGFDYSRSQVAWGDLGIERQTICFSLPKGTQARRFRLRLADRPGFIRLYSIGVFGKSGETLWRWATGFGPLALGNEQAAMSCMSADGHTLATLYGPESWLNLPWTKGDGVVPVSLTLDLGWPMSGDFEIAQKWCERAILPLRQDMNAAKALIERRDVELSVRDAHLLDKNVEVSEKECEILKKDALIADKSLALAQLEHTLSLQRDALETQVHLNLSQAAQISTLQSEVSTLQGQASTLQSEVSTLQGQASTLQSEVSTLQGQASTLQSEIARMHSFSWWLRRISYWLDQAVHRLRNL